MSAPVPPFTERHEAIGALAITEPWAAIEAAAPRLEECQDALLGLLGPDRELERAARDARLGPIGGGSDEIMKEVLGRSMGL